MKPIDANDDHYRLLVELFRQAHDHEKITLAFDPATRSMEVRWSFMDAPMFDSIAGVAQKAPPWGSEPPA